MEHKGEKYERLIVPILVGPSARIVSVAEEGGMRPLCASAAVVRRHGSACRSIRPRMRAMGPCISTRDSLVSVRVIPTDEEWTIASHTLDLLGA
ncbi:hypothetical protein WL21_18970 [Burkholderia ubonensis]|uniref:hypothetical protein n=1 Tax=Burkholderia ubonensis TaxID=101571 RepID=UPI000754ABC2|nr:hypothetical protein [Burkholderia ubonensis]KVO87198.1 hypothetical protein WJ81_16885 [Burkholderia ubonensis]KVZ66318.1 hypothetical protein WL21_18970 [Burkholderia ubonensis]KVZ69970.1 hypothetical protein WL20_05170 [Burkholderia ubonensis]